MEWIAIFLGVLIALAVYTQVISRFNDATDKINKARIITDAEEQKEKEQEGTGSTEPVEGLKPRFCPLCKSELKKHDSIYAEFYDAEPRPKVIIHGCRYCYMPSGQKTNFDIDKTKKGVENA
ncbi:MAG: hypothetical protein PHF84_03465 [bacterium]|nr:hypothetical protein [bacterium]